MGRQALEELRDAVAKADVGKLRADCCNCREVTDQPWTHLEVASDTGASLVHHYHGCSKAPDSLTRIEQEIISSAGVLRWIGGGGRRSGPAEELRSVLSL